MSLAQDVRLGFRMLARNPGFTAVAVLTLALGIGLNSTVFTFVNAVLLRGLPFENSHRIMHLENDNLSEGRQDVEVSYRDFLDWREQAESFEDLGGADQNTMNISDDTGAPERVSGAWVTANTFAMLGQEPLIGRNFLPGEDEPGALPVAILGYGLWQNRYGGDPEILGKTIRVNEVAASVVGVMPEGMKFPVSAAMWRPIDFNTEEREHRNRGRLEVFGRLKEGASLEMARAEMAGIAKRLEAQYPDTNEGIGIVVKSYNDEYNGDQIKILFLAMMGAVGFVLLVACANVANLLLARSTQRAREFSIRSALGASRGRVVRQLLVESLLLGCLGGISGLFLSYWGIRAFDLAVANVNKPYWIEFSMDWTVVGFFIAICFATSILFGLAPALHISKTDINETLKEGARGQAGGFRIKRTTSALIVAEIALTLILLVGAGLMMRSFLNLQNIDLGVETADRLTMQLGLAEAKYPDDAARWAFHEQLERKLSAVSGVRSVALTTSLPRQGARRRPFEIDGQPPVDGVTLSTVGVVSVSSRYFETMGVSVLRGRDLRPSDGTEGAEVAIVNAEFAERYWPGDDPLGRRIRFGGDEPTPWMEVLGVIPTITQGDLNRALPVVYVPYRQNPAPFVNIIARSAVHPETLSATLRREVQALDPDLPLYNVATLDEKIEQGQWAYRVFSSMFAIFGFIALVLSSIGLYAITAYGVSQRTQEIGVRLAFGAKSGDILGLVLRQGMIQLGVGLGVGLLGALAITRVLASMMIRVTPTDPLTFATVIIVLVTIGVSAWVVPARRACRVDPVVALRDD